MVSRSCPGRLRGQKNDQELGCSGRKTKNIEILYDIINGI
jgi:hypothetical protein